MNTVGHVDTIPAAGNTFARVVRTLFQFIEGKRFERTLSGPDYIVSITWRSPNKGSSMMYYATSRLDETYVRQLTDELLSKAHAYILRETGLQEGNFQMSYIVAKNLNYAVNMASGEEAAVAVAGMLANAAPQFIGPPPAQGAIAAAAAGASSEDEESVLVAEQ